VLNKEELNIRNATIDDIDAIMKIEHACFDESTIEERVIYLQRIKTFSDGFLVIEYQKEVIAMISSEIWNYRQKINAGDFYLNHHIDKKHDVNGDELYISSLAVLPRFQGHKLGEQLFLTLINEVSSVYPKVKHIILLVSENWVKAIRIYTKNLFSECCTLIDFFGDNQGKSNGIVMRKER